MLPPSKTKGGRYTKTRGSRPLDLKQLFVLFYTLPFGEGWVWSLQLSNNFIAHRLHSTGKIFHQVALFIK